MSHQVFSDYLASVFDLYEYSNRVETAVKAIKEFKEKVPFNAIAFTGQSGSAMAYPLSYILTIPLICVRKGRSHSTYKVEGCFDVESYVIVDDVSFTGRTIGRIQKSIAQLDQWTWLKKNPPVCVGIYLYNQNGFYSERCKTTGDFICGSPIIGVN